MALKGADKLRRQLLAIGPQVRRELEAAVLSAAADVAKTARALAPHDSGDLQKSIGAVMGDPPAQARSAGKSSSGRSNLGEAAEKRGIYATAYAGDDTAFYARFVEFGTKETPYRAPRQNRNYRRTAILTRAYGAHAATPAQPFFYPAYRANKKRAKAKISRAINKAIKKAVQT